MFRQFRLARNMEVPPYPSRSDDTQVVATSADPDAREHGLENVHSVEKPETDSLAGCGSEAYGNRIHCCFVVSPAGRPLHAYRSVRELLEALGDAIASHRALLENGKILHQDISENNIITDHAAEGDSKGRLIDLDLAKKLDSMPSGASNRTGTMQFMTIEVLQGKGHTYRHDVESFFYVFIWMCIRYGHKEGSDRLEAAKANESEFAPEFCGLKAPAEESRNTLFRNRDLSPFTETYKDRSIMYDGMIYAYNRAISTLGQK